MSNTSVVVLKLGPQGRVVIPAAQRQQLGLQSGDVLVSSIEQGRLVLQSRAQALANLQARVQAAAGERLLSQELINERRREAAGEGWSVQEPPA